ADAVLFSSQNLLVDESLLTGEAEPVIKFPKTSEQSELSSWVFAGTLVVKGTGIAEVKAIGTNTKIGKIGTTIRELKTLDNFDSPFRKQSRQLIKNFLIVGLILCAVVVVIYGSFRGTWLNAFLVGIALAMAVLPEEIAVVFTIFLALGAWRLSKQNVLTRKAQAIQALGAATVLCADKTGTITLNQMSLKTICVNNNYYEIKNQNADGNLPEKFHELIEYSILASHQTPFDAMEKAIKQFGEMNLANTEHLHQNWQFIKEYPLSEKMLSVSNVWKSTNGEYVIAAKGAPEAIIDLCHLEPNETNQITEHILSMTANGLRVIAVARAFLGKQDLPTTQHEFDFQFIGMLGFEDPVRPGVKQAVNECYDAGVKVIMLTGDYPNTAKNIAQQIGLKNPDNIITGTALEQISEEELKSKIKTTSVFARIMPEQKLRIIQALKANNEITIMTGDGVNDAIALKAADIGVAMGSRGTDVAREAADLVLLDDNFTSIVQAIKMGRRISDNLRKAISYIFAIHIPIAGISLLTVLFGWPIILYPIHIAFLELIIDPISAMVFEAEKEEKNIMQRPPEDLSLSFFSSKRMLLSINLGLIITLFTLGLYAYWYYHKNPIEICRAITFTSIVIANLALTLAIRSERRLIFKTLFTSKNYILRWIFVLTIIALVIVLYVPFFNKVFYFAPPSLIQLVVAIIVGIASVSWFEIYKYFQR
ncbi:MAG: cation-translocating P-type ATPase, partial [candidate division WOR-3 bacterium]